MKRQKSHALKCDLGEIKQPDWKGKFKTAAKILLLAIFVFILFFIAFTEPDRPRQEQPRIESSNGYLNINCSGFSEGDLAILQDDGSLKFMKASDYDEKYKDIKIGIVINDSTFLTITED